MPLSDYITEKSVTITLLIIMVIIVLVTYCDCSNGICETFVLAEHNAQSKGDNNHGTYILPDKEIQFQCRDKNITIYGSARLPANQNKNVPGVIIIAGSGPTDRNGNSTVYDTYKNVNTYKWIADLLAKNGYASLRYDKFGSGKTGLGLYTTSDIAGLTFKIFLQEANDALKYLGNQPGVDKNSLFILGHSEGAMIALAVAITLTPTPVGLILLEPQYDSILPILATQLYQTISADTSISVKDQHVLIDFMNTGIHNIQLNSYQPPNIPFPNPSAAIKKQQDIIIAILYNPTQYLLLSTEDRLDPKKLASQLTKPNSVFITCGEKDFNTPCDSVSKLAKSFHPGVAELVILPNTIHELRDVGKNGDISTTDFNKYPYSYVLQSKLLSYLSDITTYK